MTQPPPWKQTITGNGPAPSGVWIRAGLLPAASAISRSTLVTPGTKAVGGVRPRPSSARRGRTHLSKWLRSLVAERPHGSHGGSAARAATGIRLEASSHAGSARVVHKNAPRSHERRGRERIASAPRCAGSPWRSWLAPRNQNKAACSSTRRPSCYQRRCGARAGTPLPRKSGQARQPPIASRGRLNRGGAPSQWCDACSVNRCRYPAQSRRACLAHSLVARPASWAHVSSDKVEVSTPVRDPAIP